MSGITCDENRLFFDSPDSWSSDNIEITRNADGDLYLQIENPWAGSSETGFGETTSIQIKAEFVPALVEWLTPKT